MSVAGRVIDCILFWSAIGDHNAAKRVSHLQRLEAAAPKLLLINNDFIGKAEAHLLFLTTFTVEADKGTCLYDTEQFS